MRILHVFDHSIPLHSGYTFRSRAIVREQRALGWDTFHLTGVKHRDATALEEDIDGLHFYRTPPLSNRSLQVPGLRESAMMNALGRRLHEVAAKVKPDVIHAHSPVLNAIPALRVGRRLGVPVVYEIRAFWEDAAVDHGTSREWGMRYRMTRSLETYAIKRAGAITTICEGLRRDIIARGVLAEKVTVIPNAVDIDKFSTGRSPDPDLQQRLGLDGKQVLGFLGSFYGYEGLSLLLRATPTMLARNPGIRVLLVGGGPEEQNLKRLAQELGVVDQVVFTGRVPHDEVHGYYDLVDVLVYPRLSMRLTELVTPLKPLEAMAQGRVLVASDVGGHRELICHGETGILFEAGNADALADAILNLLAQRDKWPQMQAAGRQFVETERNWRKSVSYYRSVYGSVTGTACAH